MLAWGGGVPARSTNDSDLGRLRAQLRRTQRSLRRACVAGGIGLVALGALAGPAFLEADPSGRPRATLGVGREGHPALGLADEEGRLRAAVAVGDEGEGRVATFDERGQAVGRVP